MQQDSMPPVVAQIVISVYEDGRVGVQGPIDNKTACYGALESAKDAIREHHAKRAAGVASGVPAGNIEVPNTVLAKKLLQRSLGQAVPR